MAPLPLLILLALAFFLPGVLLLIFGWRGKRVGTQPVCAACGFDLRGQAMDPAQPQPPCPECGSTRLPRTGHHVRRRGPLVAGAVLLIFAMLGTGLTVYASLDAATLATYKPVAWLRWDARTGNATLTPVALDELLARWQAGQLDAAAAELLMQDVLTHGPAGQPALVAAALGSQWDNLGAELLVAGVGTNAQRVALAQSWVVLQPEVRPMVEQGVDVPIRFKKQTFGPDSRFRFWLEQQRTTVGVGEFESTLSGSSSGSLSGDRTRSPGSGWSGLTLRPGRDLPAELPLGPLEIKLQRHSILRESQHGPILAEWDITPTLTTQVVPPGQLVIELFTDPAAAATLEQGATVQDGRIEVRPYGSNLSVNFKSVPTGIAFALFIEHNGQRWPFGSISTLGTGGSHGFGTGSKVPDELADGDVVNLIFEPDPAVARKSTDLFRILDHRFTIPNIRIERPVATP